jgi:putative phage-type endonuclease
MQIHNLVQGTPAWHKYRAEHFNASDAPAMLGISKYKTRAQLLHEVYTGLTQEFDAATEKRFADGHRFEALARPIAEEIIGEELFPVTASEGKYSASFDGLTEDYSSCFEHKTLNDSLREAFAESQIHEQYRAQMEQQLMISGADKCLFMASKFDANDELIEQINMWYRSDPDMQSRIMNGWAQFAKDLEAYEPPEVVEAIEADVIMALPSVVIQATGELAKSNLLDVTPKFDLFIADAEANIKTVSIENGKAIGKFSREAAADCKATAKKTIAQISSVSEAVNTLEFYAKKFDKVGLDYEKEVTRLELIEKDAAINKVKAEYTEHVAALQKEVEPIRLILSTPDFATAMKSQRTVESKNAKLSQALADGKIAAEALAKDIRAKLAWINEHWFNNGGDYKFLFSDMQQVISKPMDDFQLVVTSRIAVHKAAESAKEEALRAKMQAEEETKARAKVEAETDKLAKVVGAGKCVEILDSFKPMAEPRIEHKPFMSVRDRIILAVSNEFLTTQKDAEQLISAEFQSMKEVV